MAQKVPESPTGETKKLRRRRAPNAPPTGAGIFADDVQLTNADIIHEKLRDDIVAMRLVPGTPISEKEISLAHNVSRTPVREAVLRLAKERLVEVVPKSGTFVGRIMISTLLESLVVRRALEQVNVVAAAKMATVDEIDQLAGCIEAQTKAASAGNDAAFHSADEAFHALIAKAAHHGGVWELIQQVKVSLDRYRWITLPQAGRMKMVVEEHKAVHLAIEKRNGALSAEKMDDHLNKLRFDISVFRDMHPEYFIHDIDLNDTHLGQVSSWDSTL